MNAVCPFAHPVPGPPEKRGYSGRYLTYPKTGAVIHTAEYDVGNGGDAATLYNALHAPGRQASWPYTVTREGFIFEHYPPGTTCWHCGDFWGNLRNDGIECEGYAPDKIDGPQYTALVLLLRWLHEYHEWERWQRSVNLWEHAQWSATLCAVFSTGMLDAETLIQDLEGESMDWLKERAKLYNDFMRWYVWFPTSQEDKDDPERGLLEEENFEEFYTRQISWRCP